MDYHGENTAGLSTTSGEISRSVGELLIESHEAFMTELPPDDGHRRAILDPSFTHVGIGVAVVGATSP